MNNPFIVDVLASQSNASVVSVDEYNQSDKLYFHKRLSDKEFDEFQLSNKL